MFVHFGLNLAHLNHISVQPKIKKQHRSQVSLRVKENVYKSYVSLFIINLYNMCECVFNTDCVCYFLLCYLCEL